MIDKIKSLMFSAAGIVVTILHVIFVLGTWHLGEEAKKAWYGAPPKATERQK